MKSNRILGLIQNEMLTPIHKQAHTQECLHRAARKVPRFAMHRHKSMQRWDWR